ncbi:hypothetical protein, partial [Pseudacidovorax sp. 1753]|uniref:hypothetical protein n=1 Tax=Pseudacidovorax sp. 1753 TaxID=3156419 RepID=UPI003396D992
MDTTALIGQTPRLERLLARGQVLILAHGLGEKAIDYVKDEECQWHSNNPQLWHLKFPHPSTTRRSERWKRKS